MVELLSIINFKTLMLINKLLFTHKTRSQKIISIILSASQENNNKKR